MKSKSFYGRFPNSRPLVKREQELRESWSMHVDQISHCWITSDKYQ